LRGGAVWVGAGDAVAADFGGAGEMGAATGGAGPTRAFWMLAEPAAAAGGACVGAGEAAGLPTGAVACAIPMNVAGDSMILTLEQQW
jgi:hypothetical protein